MSGISLDEFGVGVVELLNRVMVSSKEPTTHHVNAAGVHVDMVIRDHVVISITYPSEPAPEDVVSESESEESGSESDTESDSDGFTTVEYVRKNARSENSRLYRIARSTKSPLTFEVFSEDANACVMDFHGSVTGYHALKAEAAKYKRCHGYCAERNLVVNFVSPSTSSTFVPNESYSSKYIHWSNCKRDDVMAHDGHTRCSLECDVDLWCPYLDKETWHMFKDHSTWEHTFVEKVQSFMDAWDFAKRHDWSHGYCPETGVIFNFRTNSDGTTTRAETKASSAYKANFNLN